jgi:hypothetical protein
MDSAHKLLLLTNVATALILTGLIWTIQLVHYPLFAQVGSANFATYEAEHSARITLLVMPLMLAELAAAGLLALAPPPGVRAWEAWLGLALVLLAWGVTMFASVPQHAALSSGFDALAHRLLVQTNWLRTLAWSGRGLLVVVWLWRAL